MSINMAQKKSILTATPVPILILIQCPVFKLLIFLAHPYFLVGLQNAELGCATIYIAACLWNNNVSFLFFFKNKIKSLIIASLNFMPKLFFNNNNLSSIPFFIAYFHTNYEVNQLVHYPLQKRSQKQGPRPICCIL